MKQDKRKFLKILTIYYGLVQCLHLLVLARAGWILLEGETVPFPIQPPVGGWEPQAMGFLLGLGGVDLVAILMGIGFAYLWVIRGQFKPQLGVLSLTIATPSALVFAAGTAASSAWQAHPAGYWAMVALFLPAGLLHLLLIKNLWRRRA